MPVPMLFSRTPRPPWQGANPRVANSLGVPEKANKRFETAAIASANEGFLTTCQSETKGPGVTGAAAGRSCTPTATVTVITE